MDTYSRRIYLLAYSYVKDRESAEDISQDVLIKCIINTINFEEMLLFLRGFIGLRQSIQRCSAA